MTRCIAKFLLFGLLVFGYAHGSMVTISGSGKFDSTVPTGLLIAPDATWTFSLTLDQQPFGGVYGNGFEVSSPFYFGYILNGVPVVITPYTVSIGAAAYPYLELNFGAFDNGEFSFDTSTSFYSGTSLTPYDCGCYSPTLIPGDYTTIGGPNFIGLDNQGNLVDIDSGTTGFQITSAAPVPEPSSLLLGAFAICILGVIRRSL